MLQCKKSKIIIIVALVLAAATLLTGVLVTLLDDTLYSGSVSYVYADDENYVFTYDGYGMAAFTPSTGGYYQISLESSNGGRIFYYVLRENSKQAYKDGEYVTQGTGNYAASCYLTGGHTYYIYIDATYGYGSLVYLTVERV